MSAVGTALPELMHGNETRVWGDQAYRGQKAAIRRCAPRARDFVNRRYRHRGVVDEVERAKNRTKSKVRRRRQLRAAAYARARPYVVSCPHELRG